MVSVKGRESVNDVDFPQRIFQTSSKLCKVQLRYDSKLERLFVTGDLFGGLAAFSWKKFSLLRLLKLSKRLENVLFFFFFFKRKKSISTKIQSNAFSCNARKHDLSVVPVFRTYTELQLYLRFVTSCVEISY